MKGIFTKIYLFAALLVLGSAFTAHAQTYIANTVAANIGVSAVCKDASGNVYVLRVNGTPPASGDAAGETGEIVKYPAGSTTGTVIANTTAIPYSDGQQDMDYPFGIAVDSQGNIFVSTYVDYSTSFPGNILKFTNSGGNYTQSTWITGDVNNKGDFGAIVIDSHDNLFVEGFDAAAAGGNGAFNLFEYPKNSTTATTIYSNIASISTSDPALSALAVDASDNIYMGINFDQFNPTGGGGSIIKLTKSSSYGTSVTIANSTYTTGLGCDAAGNLFAINGGFNGTTLTSWPVVEYPNATGASGTVTGTTIYSNTGTVASEGHYPAVGLAVVNTTNIFLGGGDPATNHEGDLIQLIGTPSTQASNVSFSSTGPTGTTVSWTNGSGSSRAVFMKLANTGTPSPTNSTTYTAATNFGTGTQISSSGWYCIYNGTGTSVAVTGLSVTSTYRVMVVEYNGSAGVENYLTSAGTNNPNNVTTATPTISTSGSPSALTTASGTASSSTTFNVSGSNLVANVTVTAPSGFDVSLDNSSWSASGGSKTLIQSGGTLTSSPVYVRLDAGDAINSYSGNVALTSTSATTVNVAVTGTVTSPSTTISSLTASPTLTNAATVNYTATFAASVTGLTASDFSVTAGGSVSGASVGTVTGSGTTWTVPVNTGSGDGTVQLVMNSSSGVSPSVSNVSFSGTTVSIDKTLPTVSIGSPSVSIANSSTSVVYTVTYNDANFKTGSITLTSGQISGNATTTGTASISNVVIGTPSGNTVTVTITGTGDGTIAFTVPAGTASDNAGNLAAASSLSTSFTEDNTAPTVSIGSPSVSYANSSTSVVYTVTYNDANFKTGSITLTSGQITGFATTTGTASISSAVVGTPSGNTVTVTITGTGNGTIAFTVPAGTAQDNAGNLAVASSASTSFTEDNTAPTVSIGTPSVSNANSSTTVNYTVTYNDANFNNSSITLTAGQVTGNATTTGTASISSVVVGAPSGNTVQVSITGTGNGTIAFTVPAGTASDLAGNTAAASSVSASFTEDNNAPTVSSGSYFSNNPTSINYARTNDVITLSIGYNEPIQTPVITIGGHSVAATNTSGNIWGATYTVQASDPDGQMAFDVLATDLAGNTVENTSAQFGAFVTVDNTPPTVTVSSPSLSATSTGPVSYTVTYNDTNFATSSLSTSDITLNTTGTATGTVGVSGSGSSYTVTISNTTGHGTLGITVSPGAASDAAGNPDGGSSPSSTFDVTSTDALLSVFQISNGILSPAFSPSTNTYSDNIAYITTGITLFMTTDNPNATVTVNGNPVTSGVRTSTIPMSLGLNTLTIVVTAQDGVTTNTYTVAVTRQQSTNASFTSVALSPTETLVGTTGPANLNFTASVPNSVSSIQVIPTAADPTATITVNGLAVNSGSASQSITLPVGLTTITTVITAQDGTTTKNAIIKVTRAPSTDAALSSLTASVGTLSPAFSPVVYTYEATVPYTTMSTTLTPTADDATETLTVNGVPVASGSPSGAIALNVGSNTITTVTTAQSGTVTKTYTTIINRTAPSTNATLTSISLSPNSTLVGASGSGYLNYTASVPYSETSVQVIPTATDPTATITVNGSPVASGAMSQSIALSVGSSNVITTVITAQDGTTTKTVIITITRALSPDANLAGLTASGITLSPAFSASTFNYSGGSVPYATSSVMITPTTDDPGATVTVNGTTVASGTASGAIALSQGLNTITTVVTAPNGVNKQTYTTTITRGAPSTNALLATVSLTPTSSLVVTSGSGYLNYTTTVPFSETSVQETPTARDATATIMVNGQAVASGSLSQSIPLSVGPNTITTVITAQDGVTTKTLIITVNRTGAADATLSNLAGGGVTLSPAFASTTLSYTGTVPYTTSSVTLTPTTNDPNATVTVNGVAATSGSPSTVALNAGLNTIKTVVTAQNGTTTKTYTANITRTAPSNNALLASVTSTPTETLAGASGPGYLNFTVGVPNSLTSIQFTPTSKDANATITVNGTPVTSGTLSQAISLSVGANAVTIVLTAQDGVTTKTVDITVNRAMPSMNSIYQPISVTKPADNVTLNDDGIVVHQAVSPNGDGVNDHLTIENITSYPDNHLTIIDRNGIMVYEAKGYDNGSKTFDGHSNSGKMQLPGTYFFSLDYTVNGESKHKTGYIILKY